MLMYKELFVKYLYFINSLKLLIIAPCPAILLKLQHITLVN